MRILLIKPETAGIFCYTNLVDHEPLEMEYLKTVFEMNGYETLIYDRRYDLTNLRKKLKKYRPDVVCITGYITQQNLMKRYAKIIKMVEPQIRIIIGGSNAEINYENYFDSRADYIYHLSGLKNLVLLADAISKKKDRVPYLSDIKGICYRDNDQWVVTEKEAESPAELPLPDRSFFYEHIHRFGYLKFRPLALVKNSYSCRKSCSFCFCTNRNSGKYACRSVESLVSEIASLKAENIHITDDDFLIDREYLLEFVRLIKKQDIHKKYLIYGRADFIAQNEDVIKELADIGLSLVMVGLEATDNRELDSYNKHTSVSQNEECIRILNRYQIICAGLFIVNTNMTKKDFKSLYQYLISRDVIPTISVFTPMQGSAMYSQYKDKLVNKDVTKQDLFHCLIQPEHMSIGAFTRQYYKLSLKVAWKKRHHELYSTINYFNALWHIIKTVMIKIYRFIFEGIVNI